MGIQICPLPFNSQTLYYRYEGNFINNERSGMGKTFYPDNSIYSGMILNNKKNGIGKMEFTNGDVYEGEWSDNFMQG